MAKIKIDKKKSPDLYAAIMIAYNFCRGGLCNTRYILIKDGKIIAHNNYRMVIRAKLSHNLEDGFYQLSSYGEDNVIMEKTIMTNDMEYYRYEKAIPDSSKYKWIGISEASSICDKTNYILGKTGYNIIVSSESLMPISEFLPNYLSLFIAVSEDKQGAMPLVITTDTETTPEYMFIFVTAIADKL